MEWEDEGDMLSGPTQDARGELILLPPLTLTSCALPSRSLCRTLAQAVMDPLARVQRLDAMKPLLSSSRPARHRPERA